MVWTLLPFYRHTDHAGRWPAAGSAWQDAAVTADPLAEHAATWLLRWARSQLAPLASSEELGPPPIGVRAAQPATVILTAYDGRTSAVFAGQGQSLQEAVARAVDGSRIASVSARRLQLDIVQGEARPVVKLGPDDMQAEQTLAEGWDRLTSFQDGLIVGHAGQFSWLAPAQLLLQGMARRRRDTDAATPRDILDAAVRRVGLPASAWRDSSVELWQFATSAWIEDATRQRIVPLIQGCVPVTSFDRERLLESARAGGDYLLGVQQADGSFTYTVDPWLDTRSHEKNNVVRHAGTTAALFELAAATGEACYAVGGQKALDFLASWYRPSTETGLTYVLDTDGKAKLGSLGLALLALTRKLEAHPAPADREHVLQIGRQIVAMQQRDGSFDSYLRVRGDEPHGSVSLYYPGEAMLGLARAANLGIGLEEGFRTAAHRGADHLIASRQGRTRLPPDAWLIQALGVLYEDDPKASYVEHAIAISRAMLSAQYGPQAPPIYVGGIGPEPIRSTRTTARVEGMIAAVRLAARAGDRRGPAILAAIKWTVPHLLSLQYDADTSYFLDDADAVMGGMRGGLDDAEIRIDYVQHHISAMLGLAGLL
jgi:hypothetical protein